MALTKGDKAFIETALDKALIRQEFKFENKLDDVKQEFETTVSKFKDEFYTRIDPILKEVVTSREDRLIGTQQHIRNEKKIEKLEKIHPQGKHLAVV